MVERVFMRMIVRNHQKLTEWELREMGIDPDNLPDNIKEITPYAPDISGVMDL